MSRPHIVALQKRTVAGEGTRRQNRRPPSRARDVSPASSVGTFFDDDSSVSHHRRTVTSSILTYQDTESVTYQSSVTSLGSRNRADSSMSTCSDRHRVNEGETAPHYRSSSGGGRLSPTMVRSSPQRLAVTSHMRPEPLRIETSSANAGFKPATLDLVINEPPGAPPARSAQRSMSVQHSTAVFDIPTQHRRSKSVRTESSSRRRPSELTVAPPHLPAPVKELPAEQQRNANPPTWTIPNFTRPRLPGRFATATGASPLTIHTQRSAAPDLGEYEHISPRAPPPSAPLRTLFHTASSRFSSGTETPRLPSHAHSASVASNDDGSLRGFGISRTAEVMPSHDASPTYPAFPVETPPAPRSRPRAPSKHSPSPSLDSITEVNEIIGEEILLPRIYGENESTVVKGSALQNHEATLPSSRRTTRKPTLTLPILSPISVNTVRSEYRSRSDSLHAFDAKYATYLHRCNKLHKARQKLHGELLSRLENGPIPGASTLLELQQDIASTNAVIDQCVSGMARVDKRRRMLLEDMMKTTVEQRPPPPKFQLPMPERVSWSLAHVMEFLDASDAHIGLA